MHWAGKNGLYETYYLPVLKAFSKGRYLSGTFLIDNADLIGSEREGIVMVQGMRCLISNISIDVNGGRQHECDVTLFAL